MPKVLSSSYCHLSTPCGEINYTLERKYVRNINFRIKQGGELYISASPAVSKKYIEGLLSRDAGQLIRKIESAKKVSEEKRAENEDISKVCFLGKKYPLVIKNTPGERTSCVFEEGIFVINSEKDLNKEEISGMIKTWKQLKAREIYTVINKEVWEDFKAHGYKVPLSELSIRSMKSRWGSCRYTKGRISINLQLLDYPVSALYSVFYHEYMHYIHHDHSQAFYAALTKICPTYYRDHEILKME
jgi:predicted metal-dependent hydrolase